MCTSYAETRFDPARAAIIANNPVPVPISNTCALGPAHLTANSIAS